MPISLFKKRFAMRLAQCLPLSPEEIEDSIEYPPPRVPGDLAFPCFPLGRLMKKAPAAIAASTVEKLGDDDLFSSFEAAGPYVNARVDSAALARSVFEGLLVDPSRYGAGKDTGKSMVLDYSGPNIAKPFHVGHLRSTIIGHSLKRIFSHLGWKVIGINHLGDWGTQFGKLIVAFRTWGDEKKLEGDEPVLYLQELYVRFHKALEDDPSLEDRARQAFKALEDGAEEERRLWKLFTDLSLRKFYEVYDLLGVEFDFDMGESFYEDKMDVVFERLGGAGLTVESDGALVVKLDDYDMPACLLRKSDGATLYSTRELAAIFYRNDRFQPDRIVYVHGMPQQLHFRQVFKVLELYDGTFADKLHFAGFGQIRFKGMKLSTRAGNVIPLQDVIDEGIRRAREKIQEQENEGRVLQDKDGVARDVALAALLFADLSNDRIKDIEFDWDRALASKGDTGPCIQYANARARSLVRKNSRRHGDGPDPSCDTSYLNEEEERGILLAMAKLPEVIEQAASAYKPHVLAQHVLEIAGRWNSYYHNEKFRDIIGMEQGPRKARVSLAGAISAALELGLHLLGIPAPPEM